MALVGQEVEFSLNCGEAESMEETSEEGKESSVLEQLIPDEDHPKRNFFHKMGITFFPNEDDHAPLSPQGGPESFFLAGLSSQTISASALAQQIHERHLGHSSGTTIATDDMGTATISYEDEVQLCSTDESPLSTAIEPTPVGPLEKDVLSRDLLLDQVPEESPLHKQQQSRSIETMASPTPAATVPPTDDPMHVDAAEKVYGTAKNVWAWGKGVFVINPFLGLAEGIASKIVETAGSSLEEVDTVVTQKVQGLDDGILNPAIQAVVTTVLGAAGKTEDFLKPFIMTILSPFGLLRNESEADAEANNTVTAAATAEAIKAGSAAPEMTTAPVPAMN